MCEDCEDSNPRDTWAFITICALAVFAIVAVCRMSSCSIHSCEQSVRAYELCVQEGSDFDAEGLAEACRPLLRCS